MSADGSDQDTKSKSSARRSGRPKKPRVVPEDEISADGKSDEEFDEPFEGSEEDDDFEEDAQPKRKKPAGRPPAPAKVAPSKGGKAVSGKAAKKSKEVEEDEEEEDVDGDLDDEEEEEEMEGEEDDEEFSEEDSEEEGDGSGKKKNGGAKKKRDRNADAEAAMDRAQYFPNASFVIAKKDKDSTNKVDLELWRIDGKCMLQKFVGYTDEKDSLLKFKSTNAYTGWSALDKDDYMNVNVIIDPSSTQSKVIVTIDPDSTGAPVEIKKNDIDISIEDIK